MIRSLIDKVKSYFTSGSTRSVKAKKNVLYMLFIKGATILIGLVMVPLTLSYVDSGTYGIWLTLSSMIGWISFFDIGLNNGLKNKLAEAIAVGDTELGRKYVSTTYAVLTMIFIPVMIILLIFAPFIDWQNVLNISVEDSRGLLASVCVIITYFCINFILNTINVVLTADQRPADASFRNFIQQLLSLLIIFVMVKTTAGSLLKLCIGLCISPLLVVSFFNITLFSGRYKCFSPSIKYVDFHQVPVLMKLGVQFFIIQVAGVIQYQMVNFLIIRHFGSCEVTTYNIAHNYFNIVYMVWGIMTAPVWAAVTDAFAKNDISWIISMQKKYKKLFVLFFAGGLLMLLLSDVAYDLWVGDSVEVSFSMSFWVFLYTMFMMFGSIYVFILNGAGELKVQTIACSVSPFVFLGITYLLINLGCGPYAIIIGSIAANFNGFLLAPVQYSKLINRKRQFEYMEKSIIVCGIIRNAKRGLRHNMPVMAELSEHFSSFRMILFENDSTDGTKKELKRWQSILGDKLVVISEDSGSHKPVPKFGEVTCNPWFSAKRISKMAELRNRYMRYVESNGLKADYLMVVDLDVADISLKGIMSSFEINVEWDAITANGYSLSPKLKRRYHDSYALVEYGDEQNPQTEDKIMKTSIKYASLCSSDMPVRVFSAFGGLAIYRFEAIEGLRYSAMPNEDKRVEVRCEHFSLNRQMVDRGYTNVYINPAMLIKYQRISFKVIANSIKSHFNR